MASRQKSIPQTGEKHISKIVSIGFWGNIIVATSIYSLLYYITSNPSLAEELDALVYELTATPDFSAGLFQSIFWTTICIAGQEISLILFQKDYIKTGYVLAFAASFFLLPFAFSPVFLLGLYISEANNTFSPYEKKVFAHKTPIHSYKGMQGQICMLLGLITFVFSLFFAYILTPLSVVLLFLGLKKKRETGLDIYEEGLAFHPELFSPKIYLPYPRIKSIEGFGSKKMRFYLINPALPSITWQTSSSLPKTKLLSLHELKKICIKHGVSCD